MSTIRGQAPGSFGTIIGSPPNALMVGYLSETYGIEIGFGQWMAVGVPLSIVLLLLAWFVLTQIVFRTEAEEIPGEKEVIRAELDRLGPMYRPQKLVIAVFVGAALSWVFLPLVWPGSPITDEVVAIIAAVLLFLLPSGAPEGGRLLEWTDTKELPWGILLLFGGGLALASQITASGLSTWIGDRANGLAGLPPIVLVAAVCLITVLLTEFMSNTAAAATLLPIMGGVAVSLGQSPLLLAMPVALAAACTFMMPAATPPNAIAFSSGYVRIPDMVRGGAPLSLSSIVLITATVYALGGWVFHLTF
ncbi:MAG: SLC13 family permease [Cellulomonadaceae bacterium]